MELVSRVLPYSDVSDVGQGEAFKPVPCRQTESLLPPQHLNVLLRLTGNRTHQEKVTHWVVVSTEINKIC
jgi:hypothetical protein